MRKKNVVYGDICKLDVIISENKKEHLDNNGNITNIEVSGTLEFVDVPVRRKVVLVKLPKHKYIEATKLKTTKDLIDAYKDVLFNTDLYTINAYPRNVKVNMTTSNACTTGYVEAENFVSESSIEKFFDNNIGNISVKKLAKELN